MNGWIVVNGFIKNKKFLDIYDLLAKTTMEYDISIKLLTTQDLVCTLDSKFAQFDIPDFILFWDKDIYLANRLEHIGIRVFNSAGAIEICDNKALTSVCMEKSNIPYPKTIIAPKTFEGIGYSDLTFFEKAKELLGMPMIVKEVYGSFGQQVYLLKNDDEAEALFKRVGYKDLILQEYIGTSAGRDVRINVVGGRAVSSMLRYNDSDFRSNITNGGKMKPINISKEQEKAAIDACAAVGADFAGVDVLFGEGGMPIICEINSNPHFRSSIECTGVNISDYIIRHILGVVYDRHIDI